MNVVNKFRTPMIIIIIIMIIMIIIIIIIIIIEGFYCPFKEFSMRVQQ